MRQQQSKLLGGKKERQTAGEWFSEATQRGAIRSILKKPGNTAENWAEDQQIAGDLAAT